jgi:hypothetical protein
MNYKNNIINAEHLRARCLTCRHSRMDTSCCQLGARLRNWLKQKIRLLRTSVAVSILSVLHLCHTARTLTYEQATLLALLPHLSIVDMLFFTWEAPREVQNRKLLLLSTLSTHARCAGCRAEAAPEEGALRLFKPTCGDNGDFITGDLQVYRGGKWTWVCYDGFDQVDVNVACQQLGFAKGWIVGRTGGPFTPFDPPNPFKPLFDFSTFHVDCKGGEKRLVDCAFKNEQDPVPNVIFFCGVIRMGAQANAIKIMCTA